MKALPRLVCFVSTVVAMQVVGAEPTPQTILDGLNNPCGVAVQPGTGHVFVSESGAGRVVRIVDGKMQEVVVEFPQEVYSVAESEAYQIGPLGLTFQNEETLIVGGGGSKPGKDVVYVYSVPPFGSDPVPASDAKTVLGPLPGTAGAPGDGDFYGVAVTQAAVFVTCQGDDEKGWVSQAAVRADGYGLLERFIATKQAVGADAPVAIAIGPGGNVVVGQAGEASVPRDSLLSFYNANSGRLLMNLKTELYDITGLAYSTLHKERMYAIDFAQMTPSDGGLFRLDAGLAERKPVVQAVKIASLERPTAMAFAPGGTLYVTVFGNTIQGAPETSGRLVKFLPGL